GGVFGIWDRALRGLLRPEACADSRAVHVGKRRRVADVGREARVGGGVSGTRGTDRTTFAGREDAARGAVDRGGIAAGDRVVLSAERRVLSGGGGRGW